MGQAPQHKPTSLAPAPPRKCYTAVECAHMIGISVDEFYQQREKLHDNGMPRSATPGRIRIPKLAFDAWLNRDHPNAPRGRPANDPVPLPHPQSDDEHRDHLRRVYARR